MPPGSRSNLYEPILTEVGATWLWVGLRKRKFLITLILCAVVLPTVLFVNLAKPIYRAEATIQIDPESAKVLPYKEVTDALVNPVPHFELYLKTQDSLLRSSTLAERTRNHVSRAFPYLDQTALPQDLTEGLQIERIEGSQILKIGYLAPEPRLAAAFANAWADELVLFHLEQKAQTGEKATEFLQTQLTTLKKKVEKAERDLIDYARSNNILNIDSRQEDVIRQRFGYLSAEVAKAEKELIARQAAYEATQAASVEDFPESLKSPVIAEIENRYLQAEQELSRLLAQFDEKWPAVVQKRRDVSVTKAQLAQAKQAGLDRARRQAEIALKASRSEFSMLHDAFKAQESVVTQLNQASVEYNNLKREFDASEQLYQGLLQRLKETGVSSGLDLGNIEVIDHALADPIPYRPRKLFSIGLSVILGLILGVALSVIVEYQDHTLRDPWEVEQLGLPLLAWIPKIWNQPRLKGEDGEMNSAAVTIRRTNLPESAVSQSESWARESYRMLSTSVLLSRSGSPPRTILVTSAAPREGKTTTTVSLGVAFAQMGSPTLLIDADFRNPALSTGSSLQGTSEGLSTFLAGGKLVIQETNTPNLYLLPTGPTPPSPVALFSGERMAEAMQALSARFKFVLLDSAPLLGVADAQTLSTKVDGVILVVQSGKTPRDIVRKAVVLLQRTGACLLGSTVTQVDLKNPQYSDYSKYYCYKETKMTAAS